MSKLEELYAQQAAIAKAIEEEKKASLKGVIEQVQALINTHSLEAKDFKWGKGTGKTKKPATPKFLINGVYWSGRGRPSREIIEAMKNENLTLDQVKEKYKI